MESNNICRLCNAIGLSLLFLWNVSSDYQIHFILLSYRVFLVTRRNSQRWRDCPIVSVDWNLYLMRFASASNGNILPLSMTKQISSLSLSVNETYETSTNKRVFINVVCISLWWAYYLSIYFNEAKILFIELIIHLSVYWTRINYTLQLWWWQWRDKRFKTG